MPSYGTGVAQALYPGGRVALVNDASTDSGITTTIAFAVGGTSGNNAGTIDFINTTDKEATGQLADQNVDGSYKPASGLIVGSGAALPYNLAGGWVRFTFASAPTSGSLVATR